MKDVDTYKKINPLSNVRYDFYLKTPIKTHFPQPTARDYEVSYITRYFIRKTNDFNAIIYEVNDRELYRQSRNPFYTSVTIQWKISKAPVEQIELMNWRSILEGENKINNLRLYLPNLSQFYKDIEY